MTYQQYIYQMQGFRQIPMSEKDFNKMEGIETEKEIPVFIARKSASAKEIEPTLNAHIKNG